MRFCQRCEWPILVDPDAELLAELAGERFKPTCWNGCHLGAWDRPTRREPSWAVPSVEGGTMTDYADHLVGDGRWGSNDWEPAIIWAATMPAGTVPR